PFDNSLAKGLRASSYTGIASFAASAFTFSSVIFSQTAFNARSTGKSGAQRNFGPVPAIVRLTSWIPTRLIFRYPETPIFIGSNPYNFVLGQLTKFIQ